MNRRKFLVSTGSAILTVAGVRTELRQPTVASDFELTDVEQKAANKVDSVVIDFQNFRINPKYIDSSGKMGIRIKVDIDGHKPVEKTTSVQVENDSNITKNDINDLLPIFIDDISPTGDFVTGIVKIKLDHPDITETYRQSFSISDVSINLFSSDLSAWWKLDGTGSKATDSTKNNYNGSISGDITQGLPGKGGLNSYQFDGSNDYVDISSRIGNASSGGWSVCAWIKLDSLATDEGNALPICDIDDNQPCGIRAYIGYNNSTSDEDRMAIRARGTGGPDGWGSTDLQTDKWYHVTGVVYSNGTYDIYLNGQLDTETSQNSDLSNSGGVSYIGRGSGSNYFPGQICDLRIYDTALTGTQVQTIYNQGFRDDLDDVSV